MLVDANGHPHQHVLGPLHDLAIHFQQVGPLQSLEPKVVVLEVPVVDDDTVQTLLVL
jgi:hypothetical protein